MKRVTPAISKGIAENKETMIDALYPIMGGMISKYVTQAIKELMETINKKIERGLSFENYKRKAKAKLSGVSEMELLLEESSGALISSLFVIHKESSLLIAEANLENKEINDAHMVASMASAIKDFINDWVKNSETKNEVQILSYGNATLYIESAGSVYIIAFLDAEPDYEQRTDINEFFAKIVKEYAPFFQKFDGDDSSNEIVTLSLKMEDYLYKQIPLSKEEKKNPAKMILVLLALLLLGYGTYLFNGWYIKNSLENTVYAQTGEQINISDEGATYVLSGQVTSTDVIYEIEELMKRQTKKTINNKLLVPMRYIDKRLQKEKESSEASVEKLESKLASLESGFEKSINGLQEKIFLLTQELQGSDKRLKVLLKDTTDEITVLKEEKARLNRVLEIKNEIFTRLDHSFSKSPYYNKEEHTLDFRKLEVFIASEALYKKEAIQVIAEVFTKYMMILVQYKEYIRSIIIEGHSDSTGLEEDNVALSHKRALAVKYYLERLNIVKQYHMKPFMKIEAYGSARAIEVDGIENKKASRRIKIKFELKESQIINNLRKIIND